MTGGVIRLGCSAVVRSRGLLNHRAVQLAIPSARESSLGHANTLTAVTSPGGSHVTGCAPGRGHVALQGVIHHHAIGIEAPAESADGSLHALDPAARQSVTIALVV